MKSLSPIFRNSVSTLSKKWNTVRSFDNTKTYGLTFKQHIRCDVVDSINSPSSLSPSCSSCTSFISQYRFFSVDMNLDKHKDVKLKQLIRPFLLTYHPDRLAISSNHDQSKDNNSHTDVAREANLKAIQTLNGMIDTIDHIYNRALYPSQHNHKGSRTELQSTYTIEFLVPSNNDTDDNNSHRTMKQREAISTRRSVDLHFTDKERSIIQSIDTKTGKYSITAAKIVKLKAMKEIKKLLRVAGLNVPDFFDKGMEQTENEIKDDVVQKDRLNIHDQLILEELDLDGDLNSNSSSRIHMGRTFDGSMGSRQSRQQQFKSEYEKSRDRFMAQFDWKEYRKLYDEAEEDMKRDIATDGLIKMNEERKHRLVADIVSRVRVQNLSEGFTSLPDEKEYVATVDPLQQLIAIRRISLLFTDNFEELEMEEMGKMWENVSIILIPERDKGTDNSGMPFSRRKRLRKGKESGFKFSFHDESRISIHVPIDFLDDELIGEMKRHLSDFYDLCVRDALEQFFPKYYDQFAGHPRIE